MSRNGMITLEVCVLIALVAAASLASERYLRGAIQGNWRGNADAFSDEQYNPPDDEAIDPGSSSEYGKTEGDKMGNTIIIENPTLGMDVNITGTNTGSFDLVSGTGTANIQVSGSNGFIVLTDWKDK